MPTMRVIYDYNTAMALTARSVDYVWQPENPGSLRSADLMVRSDVLDNLLRGLYDVDSVDSPTKIVRVR